MEEKARSKDEGRVPPHDIDAEKSLLGALLIASDLLPEILTVLKPADFYDERHSTIFQAMIDLYDKHQPVDLLTLTAELRSKRKLREVGGAPYLTELSNFTPTSSHAKAYAKIVEQASVRRRLIHAGTEIAKKAYEEGSNADELIGKAERDLFEVSDKIVRSDYVPMDELLADAFDRIEELHKNKGVLRGLKTGFRDLDKKTAGLQKGDLIIVGARPAMGKTTFAQNLDYNIASINKKGVLFFSMEWCQTCRGWITGKCGRGICPMRSLLKLVMR